MEFKAGQFYGNDLTVEVLSRTDKTLTIKSVFGTKRVKVREYMQGVEGIMFKSWYITANENYDADKAAEISMYNAYHR